MTRFPVVTGAQLWAFADNAGDTISPRRITPHAMKAASPQQTEYVPFHMRRARRHVGGLL